MVARLTLGVNAGMVLPMPKEKEPVGKKARPRVVLDKPEGSDKLWEDARVAALRAKKTISEWVFDALREKLTRDKK